MEINRSLSKSILVIGKTAEPTLTEIQSLLRFLEIDGEYSVENGRDTSHSGHNSIVLILDLEGADRSTLVSRLSRAAHVILNLEDVETVKLALDVKEKFSWISTREPRKILGALVDLFKGTYFDHSDQAIIDTVDGIDSEYKAYPRVRSDILPLVATIAVAERLEFAQTKSACWLRSLPSANSTSYQYSSNNSSASQEVRSHL